MIKPSDFMRELRPECCSHRSGRTDYQLDRALLDFHLSTITARNQTQDFEVFCRRLGAWSPQRVHPLATLGVPTTASRTPANGLAIARTIRVSPGETTSVKNQTCPAGWPGSNGDLL